MLREHDFFSVLCLTLIKKPDFTHLLQSFQSNGYFRSQEAGLHFPFSHKTVEILPHWHMLTRVLVSMGQNNDDADNRPLKSHSISLNLCT